MVISRQSFYGCFSPSGKSCFLPKHSHLKYVTHILRHVCWCTFMYCLTILLKKSPAVNEKYVILSQLIRSVLYQWHFCSQLFMCWTLTVAAILVFTHYQLSFLEPNLSQHFSWGNDSDPKTDLILQSCPWHLNWPPGKEWIHKDNKRGKSCKKWTVIWKGFKSSAGTR